MRLFILLLALSSLACDGDQRRSPVPSPDTLDSASTSVTGIPNRSPELASRADSLERLDPEREARAAIARGDLRFLAVCGYACMPVGVPLDSALRSADSMAVRKDSVHAVAGTSDFIVNQDVDRLNRVAGKYAARYNRVIWARRKELRPSLRAD
jgi:hypothetical protein